MNDRKTLFTVSDNGILPPREGELYGVFDVEGVKLEIHYGYYHPESERGVIDPMPLFPNFEEEPTYTERGYPLVNADGAICEHFSPRNQESFEDWCNDCRYLERQDTCLGVCRCEQRRKMQDEAQKISSE